MTAEQVIKLDEIRKAQDLVWRKKSYDSGHPKCLCSACGLLIKAEHAFENEPGYGIGCCEAQGNNFPIRLWNGKGKNMIEAVLHTECFQWLQTRGAFSKK